MQRDTVAAPAPWLRDTVAAPRRLAVGTEPRAAPPNGREAAAAQERARAKEVRAKIEQSRINRVAVDLPERISGL